MKTIVVAYDGSDCSEAIFTELQDAGLPSQLTAHVVSVAELWAMQSMLPPASSNRSELAAALEQAVTVAEEGAERLRAVFPRWVVMTVGLTGSAAGTIAHRAQEVAADLVFIGSQGRSVVGRFFLGSVSQKVASEARCSVRICRPHSRSGSAPRLVVAMDGSTSSQEAVRCVAGRAWRAGTAVAVVNVIDPPLRAGLTEPPSPYAAEIHRQHVARLQWLETVTADAQRQLESAGLATERHSLDGEPKFTLVEWSERWSADCLFIGASGLHHPGSQALGTVASALAMRAHCSVEIVRSLKDGSARPELP